MIEQSAFVLHSRPYRENQLLVDLLTETEGKVSATVFVGQSKRSIKKALLQPFLPLKVTLKSQNNFKQIKSIDSIAKSYPLVKNSLYSAFYINELLIRLLKEQIECHHLFSQYQTSLYALAQGSNIASELRKFELTLLEELGLSFDFTPIFEHDVSHFYYIAEQGFVPVYQAEPKNLTKCFVKSHLEEIAEQSDIAEDSPSANTFKLLMRQVINQLLGNKPLNSRKLFIKSNKK